MLVMLLYSNMIIQYAVIGILLVMMVALVIKNRKMIISLIKGKKGKIE